MTSLLPKCSSLKKDGTPCSMPYLLNNGRCKYHQSSTFCKYGVNCNAIKPDGTQCKMKQTLANGKCIYHQRDCSIPRCSGITRCGEPCRQINILANGKCIYHQQGDTVNVRPGQVDQPQGVPAPLFHHVEADEVNSLDDPHELVRLRENNEKLKLTISTLMNLIAQISDV